MSKDNAEQHYMSGRFLLATPAMGDHRFRNALIYICSHDAEGAMGIAVNKAKAGLHISDLLEQIGIEGEVKVADTPVLNGGPVDIDRGFVLHSSDYFKQDTSLKLTDTLMLTSTKDVLQALVEADLAPEKAMLAVGYSGWGPGQLESEIRQNAWLVIDGAESMIFDEDLSAKRQQALDILGVSAEALSFLGGNA
jgi:putative transcriptional regulator